MSSIKAHTWVVIILVRVEIRVCISLCPEIGLRHRFDDLMLQVQALIGAIKCPQLGLELSYAELGQAHGSAWGAARVSGGCWLQGTICDCFSDLGLNITAAAGFQSRIIEHVGEGISTRWAALITVCGHDVSSWGLELR